MGPKFSLTVEYNSLVKLGKINFDQVRNYAQRKGIDIKIMEKWLAPNLGYDSENN